VDCFPSSPLRVVPGFATPSPAKNRAAKKLFIFSIVALCLSLLFAVF